MGIQLMNATKLRQMIFADINLAIDDEQIDTIQEDVYEISQFIEKYNSNAIWLRFGKSSVVEAWRQVVEVVMLSECTGEDCISFDIKRKKIFDILRLVNEQVHFIGGFRLVRVSYFSNCRFWFPALPVV